MKAIEVSIRFDECGKLQDFIREAADDDIFIYRVASDVIVIVAEGECSLGYVKARVEQTFEEVYIKELK